MTKTKQKEDFKLLLNSSYGKFAECKKAKKAKRMSKLISMRAVQSYTASRVEVFERKCWDVRYYTIGGLQGRNG